MRSHPEAGVELLRGIDFPEDVIPIVLSHHEKWDGTGYPHGLTGEAIPLAARVLGLADVYDALRTDRSYKKGMTHEVALQTMRRSSGTHFDPVLFRVFEEVASARTVTAAAFVGDGSGLTNLPAGGSVTQVATGTGLLGGPITTTGTLSLDLGFTDARYAQLSASNSFSGQQVSTNTVGSSAWIGYTTSPLSGSSVENPAAYTANMTPT